VRAHKDWVGGEKVRGKRVGWGWKCAHSCAAQLDEIKAYLDKSEFTPPALGVPDLEEGASLKQPCGETPCLLLLTDGEKEELLLQLAAEFAGEITSLVHVDTVMWPVVASHFGVRPGQSAAVFLGPLSGDVVDGALVVQRVLSKRKKFTKAGCVVSAHTRISPVALADTAPHVCPCSDRASRAAAAAAAAVTCARSRSGL
jgi:hypothetical protein